MRLALTLCSLESDPRILHDVQRALKLKARREARLKGELTTTSVQRSPLRPEVASGSSMSSGSSPTRANTFNQSTLVGAAPVGSSIPSEIDFRPSTGVPRAEPGHHPTPSSLDDGVTLDWTGPGHEEDKLERRWTMSITKRRGKEALPPLELTAEQQEQKHECAQTYSTITAT